MALKLRTPEHIQSLPGYVAKVDPKKTPLSRILAYYYIRPFEMQCALCGTRHMDGCVVELENHSVTSIGHICGGHFGDKFSEEKRKFSESERRPELIKKMAETSAKLSSIHFQLEDQKYRAATLAQRHANFATMFPDLCKELTRRAINNQHGVFKYTELSEEQIDEEKAAHPYKTRDELRVKEEFKGSVSGYKFPSINLSFSDGIRRFFSQANNFSDLTSRATMSMQDLTKWTNWGEDLDAEVAALASAIKVGEEFFSDENFQLFQLLPVTTQTRNKLKCTDPATLDRPLIAAPLVLAPVSSSGRHSAPAQE